ncbi:hypothetical protein [Streptomyces sp. NPDC059639]|uniref:hypothetical protein n=1 Tax=Streptomyces sp. NPDC059639 TaxID=3346891 RepID=UPI00369FEA41
MVGRVDTLVHDPVRPAGVFEVITTTPDAVEAATAPAPGLLGAHIHATPDGERAVVIAEWSDATARTAVAPTPLPRSLIVLL